MNTSISLTIYDIVGYLLPGSAFLLSLRYFSDIGKNLSDTQASIYLIIFGYIIGVFLHLIGHFLFAGIYKEDYPKKSLRYRLVNLIDIIISKSPLLKVKKIDNGIKDELKKIIKKKFKLELNNRSLDLYCIADTFVASLPFHERELLMAKEGLLRSLTILAIIETIYLCFFICPTHRLGIIIVGLLIVELLRYGREYNRTIKNQQIYILTLMKLQK